MNAKDVNETVRRLVARIELLEDAVNHNADGMAKMVKAMNSKERLEFDLMKIVRNADKKKV